MGEISPAMWLGDVLRAAGQQVIEHAGWRTRSRPASTGSFLARAVVLHDDGSRRGSSPNEPGYLISGDGEGSAKPGPLCQLWVDYEGRWHLIASGRCNHAGLGDGWGVIPANSGNTYAIGIETDNTDGEGHTAAQYAAIIGGVAAIMRHLGADPADALCGHKEYAPGRKIDPDDLDMARVRADVAAAMRDRMTIPSGGDDVTAADVWADKRPSALDGTLSMADMVIRGTTYAHQTADMVRQLTASEAAQSAVLGQLAAAVADLAKGGGKAVDVAALVAQCRQAAEDGASAALAKAVKVDVSVGGTAT